MLAIYFLAFLHVTIENETFHVSPDFSFPSPHTCHTLICHLFCLVFLVSFVLHYTRFSFSTDYKSILFTFVFIFVKMKERKQDVVADNHANVVCFWFFFALA
jgi:hypothetical protein